MEDVIVPGRGRAEVRSVEEHGHGAVCGVSVMYDVRYKIQCRELHGDSKITAV